MNKPQKPSSSIALHTGGAVSIGVSMSPPVSPMAALTTKMQCEMNITTTSDKGMRIEGEILQVLYIRQLSTSMSTIAIIEAPKLNIVRIMAAIETGRNISSMFAHS